MRCAALLWLGVLIVAGSGCSSVLLLPTDPVGTGVRVEPFVAGMDFPVAMAFAPDGRLFVTDKNNGQLRVIENGTLVSEPVVTVPVNNTNEAGLLGVAVHPDFAENNWAYLFYSRLNAPAGSDENRVVRYTLDGNLATGTEELLLSAPLSSRHNGGNLRFGPNGKLYVTIGDASSANSAQDLDALTGRILRLNDDGTTPTDNPFGSDNATYAMGLRNSFDLAFDPLADTLFATENGTSSHDEVNRIVAGGNYGWPEVEGVGDGTFIDPIIDETGTPVSPTGIDFAPDDRYGAGVTGDLFYAEYLAGKVWQVKLNEARDAVSSRSLFVEGLPGITDIAFGPDGTLYITAKDLLYRVLPD